jgi:hypothetical protein
MPRSCTEVTLGLMSTTCKRAVFVLEKRTSHMGREQLILSSKYNKSGYMKTRDARTYFHLECFLNAHNIRPVV